MESKAAKPYLLKTKEGYVAFTDEESGLVELDDSKVISKIDELVKARRDAGLELSRILINSGLTNAGDDTETNVVGEER